MSTVGKPALEGLITSLVPFNQLDTLIPPGLVPCPEMAEDLQLSHFWPTLKLPWGLWPTIFSKAWG